jgi:CubicO group peptidase (beta-lactamase class C family)
MRQKIRTIFCIPILLMWGIGTSGLGDSQSLDLDGDILNEMATYKIPSITACIVKNDEIVWKKAYGYADKGQNRPATTDTTYLLASVSKLIVVTAVMQLAERGVIDIDRDISLYLPFVVRSPHYPGQDITARMLLTHSSGMAGPETDDELPGFYDWYLVDSAPPLEDTFANYLLPGGSAYVPAVWKENIHGQREVYSNLGTTLLAYVVEFISGEDFNTYCRNHIFLPLDMPNTSFRFVDLDMSDMATLYFENYIPMDHYSRRDYPAGQLRSSIEEFSHFLIACMNGGIYQGYRILEESTFQEVLQIHNFASGLCLIWNCTLGGWYGHAGGVNGASTYVEFHKEHKVGLVIFSNVYLGRNSTLQPPLGKVYGLIRREANTFRDKPVNWNVTKHIKGRILR